MSNSLRTKARSEQASKAQRLLPKSDQITQLLLQNESVLSEVAKASVEYQDGFRTSEIDDSVSRSFLKAQKQAGGIFEDLRRVQGETKADQDVDKPPSAALVETVMHAAAARVDVTSHP